MSRIIKINSCKDCPLILLFNSSDDKEISYCNNVNPPRKITTLGVISKWCNLEKLYNKEER
ncbi:MAG: hypothetical protein H8D97_01250 [Proteobacteria bacterium]|nr:hypothetical protein [Pseudomonadota bacterium]